MGPGPNGAVSPAEAERLAAEEREARTEAALQAGWDIRYDPVRLEYRASRELLTARTLDGLLDAIKEGPEAHEVAIVPGSAYSVTGRNSGRPANLLLPWDYPAEALCTACGQTVSCKELTGGRPDWKHAGRKAGET